MGRYWYGYRKYRHIGTFSKLLRDQFWQTIGLVGKLRTSSFQNRQYRQYQQGWISAYRKKCGINTSLFPSSSMGYISKNEASRRVATRRDASRRVAKPRRSILAFLAYLGLFGLFWGRFGTIWTNFGPFWPILCQIWAFLAYFGPDLELFGLILVNFKPLWPILGHI